jgi:putative phosphoesterase
MSEDSENSLNSIEREDMEVEIDLGNARCIGIVSDTHVPHRMKRLPDAVLQAMQGMDAILHAGDVEDYAVLRALGQIAPVYAVRGNLHWQFTSGVHDQELPAALRLRWRTQRIWMTHGHLNFGMSLVDKALSFTSGDKHERINAAIIRRLQRVRPAESTVVIFGHSHRSVARTIDGVLYYNPGAVAKHPASTTDTDPSNEGPRVGILRMRDDGGLDAEWVSLE